MANSNHREDYADILKCLCRRVRLAQEDLAQIIQEKVNKEKS